MMLLFRDCESDAGTSWGKLEKVSMAEYGVESGTGCRGGARIAAASLTWRALKWDSERGCEHIECAASGEVRTLTTWVAE